MNRVFLRVRKCLRPILRLVLRVLGRRGPVRGVYQTSRDYAERSREQRENGVRYAPIFPEEITERPYPLSLAGDLQGEFSKLRLHTAPECFVLGIPKGRVLSNRGTVLTPGHKLLFDVSNQMSVRRDFAKVQFHQAFQRNIFPPIRRVQGRVAVLVTAAGGNYFHWLTEALPRLRLLEIAEGGIDRIDSFVVNQGASFIGESLDLLGVPLSRRIDTDWNTHLKADELLVPSLPGVTLNPPRWACSFLQERMLPHGAPSGKGPRIYIRRGQTNRRFVRNEEEILAVLEDFGFVSVDPGEFDLKEQIAIFRDAEVIVGSHGAALANLLWCGSGTKVLELLPLHRPGKWFWPYCYWALSASCDLDYHCLQSLETDGDHDKELYADQSFSSTEIRQWLEHHV